MPESNLDFARSKRITYNTLCMIGSLLSYYLRNIVYAQMSYTYKGCQKVIFNRPWIGTLKIDPEHGPKCEIYHLSSISSHLYHRYAIFCFPFYSYSIVENEGSISIALRFFNLLFIVLINYLVFRPKKYAFQWTALAIVLVGIIFVSCSVLVGTNTKLNLIAVVLQVIAQIIQSTKSTIEQKLLHENDICPWWLTGVEGCYDFLFIFFIFNPIAYVLPEKTFNKLHENFCDSTLMVIHSKIIVILFFIYFPISCLYNGCVLGTIMTTDSISYTIVEMIGTSIGWIIDLIIYHGFNGVLFIKSNKTFGAQWTKYSYLRLVGSLSSCLEN